MCSCYAVVAEGCVFLRCLTLMAGRTPFHHSRVEGKQEGCFLCRLCSGRYTRPSLLDCVVQTFAVPSE